MSSTAVSVRPRLPLRPGTGCTWASFVGVIGVGPNGLGSGLHGCTGRSPEERFDRHLRRSR